MSNENKPALEHLHKYGLLEHPQKELKSVKILVKDGVPCKCHKVQHAIVAGAIEGQYMKDYEHCSTHCSRAQLIKSEDNLFYYQTCEAIPNKFLIENAEIKPKSNLQVHK